MESRRIKLLKLRNNNGLSSGIETIPLLDNEIKNISSLLGNYFVIKKIIYITLLQIYIFIYIYYTRFFEK